MDLIPHRADRIVGVLLGTAVGDALGLPYEGMSPDRIARLAPRDLRHRLIFGRGLVSDDTEHACLTAAALVASRGDPRRFARELAARLKLWLLALPAAVGWATLRALVRLWLGFSPERSGVRSAGNGPCMRAAILGVAAEDEPQMQALVRVSTLITHRDERALEGARMIARAARILSREPAVRGEDLWSVVSTDAHSAEMRRAMDALGELLRTRASCAEAAAAVGLERGVTGYVVHSAPIALYCTLRASSPAEAVESVIRLGGDTDTTAAIVGALLGARDGARAFPPEWVDGIVDWPLAIDRIEALGRTLAGDGAAGSIRWWALPLRNVVFTAVVLGHGLRRLLPPW